MKKLGLSVAIVTALCGALTMPVTAETRDATAVPPVQNQRIGAGQRRAQAQRPQAAAVDQRLDNMDTNNDDKVSQEEFVAARVERVSSLISHLDQNGDGLLSQEELSARREQAAGKDRPLRARRAQRQNGAGAGGADREAIAACMAKANADFDLPERPDPEAIADRFGAIDTNGDGKLSLNELTASVTARAQSQFARLDKDGDGYLSAADRKAGEADRAEMSQAVRDCMKSQR